MDDLEQIAGGLADKVQIVNGALTEDSQLMVGRIIAQQRLAGRGKEEFAVAFAKYPAIQGYILANWDNSSLA